VTEVVWTWKYVQQVPANLLISELNVWNMALQQIPHFAACVATFFGLEYMSVKQLLQHELTVVHLGVSIT